MADAYRHNNRQLVIKVLERHLDKTLNMDTWIESTEEFMNEAVQNLECGTAACAAGLLALDDEVRDSGLVPHYLGITYNAPLPHNYGIQLLDYFGKPVAHGYGALARWLDFSSHEAHEVFSPASYEQTFDRDKVPASEVLARYKKVLKKVEEREAKEA